MAARSVCALLVAIVGSLAATPLPARASIACSSPQADGARTCTVVAERAAADVPAQARSKWCWAAAIAGLFSFYGHSIAQTRIVLAAHGTLGDLAGDETTIFRELNRAWQDDRGVRFIVRAQVIGGAEAAQELAAGRPVLITTANHAVVLTALTYLRLRDGTGALRTAVVEDPTPGVRAPRELSGAELRAIHAMFRVVVREAT